MHSKNPTRRRSRAALYALLAGMLAGGALPGCGEEAPPREPVVRPIKMLTIGGDTEGTREYPGRLRAGQQVDMAFEVPGRIVEFVYTEGSPVEAGEILAQLDPRDYQNQLEQAEAVRAQAATFRDRIKIAHDARAVSDQDMTNAQAQVEVAEAEVRIRKKALEDTRLVAPFDGIMARKLVEDFANVQAKEPVLVFEETDEFEIKVSVPERDLAGRRRAGDTREAITARVRPQVIVTSLPEERFSARLKELATHADPVTRTYQATFRFDSPEEVVILPGMTAKVIVHLATDRMEDGVVIPAHAAVADEAGAANVWKVDPDSMAVSRSLVTLGELQGDSVIVTSGLVAGDVIAVSGVAELSDGMVVRGWESRGGVQ